MLPRVNFYLIFENFLRGFCSLLEAPSGHLPRVGLWIPSAQLSPPWWHDIWIDQQSSSAGWTLRESVYTCVRNFQIPDSLLQLPGLSTHWSDLAYKLNHAVALLVKCPGGIENIFLMSWCNFHFCLDKIRAYRTSNKHHFWPPHLRTLLVWDISTLSLRSFLYFYYKFNVSGIKYRNFLLHWYLVFWWMFITSFFLKLGKFSGPIKSIENPI